MHPALSVCQNKAVGNRKAQTWGEDDAEAIIALSLFLHHFFHSLEASWLRN